MIKNISSIISINSSIVFDYQDYFESKEIKINESLAHQANEEMKSKYTYKELEKILEDNGLLIYEYLNSDEMKNNYFDNYNILNPNNKIKAPNGICYCLAIKKQV